MWLRANVVLAVAVVFAVIQMFASATGGPRIGGSGTVAGVPDGGLSQSVAAQEEDNDEDNDDDDEDNDGDDEDNDGDDDDNDEDNDEDCDDDDVDNEDDDNDGNEDDDNEDDDNEDDDNEDDDNEDGDCEDDDNDDSDNDEDDSDNDEDDVAQGDAEAGNGAAVDAAPTATPAAAAPSAPAAQMQPCAPTRAGPAPAPGTEVQGLTTGRDLLLALPNNRLSVQVLSTTPAGTCLVLHLVDPLAYPAAPGVRAGDFIFQLEAFDQFGAPVSPLPAEVTLNVQFTDTEVAGLDETLLTFSRLNPLDQTWTITPNVFVDPTTNWIWVSVLDTGVYVVHMP